ncbi:MAG: hypothetical protein ACRCZJ_07070 [Erysipelotrichaceae bacterium]
MSNIINITTIEQLKQFLNDSGIAEIAIRGAKSKFKQFQKISLEQLVDSNNQEIGKQVLNAIGKNTALLQKNALQLNKLANMQHIAIGLNGLSLCATAAGFAVMYYKLDKISNQIGDVLGAVKQGQEINANYEFKKVLSTHADMLDYRKTQRYYSEQQMRELVDAEYNVLSMLIEVYMKGVCEDTETILESIFALASMLSVSIVYFDELYYTNNSENIVGDDIWHASHKNWMKVFDVLTSKEFVEILQDYTYLEAGLSCQECDYYCVEAISILKDAKSNVYDNQYILEHIGFECTIQEFNEMSNNLVASMINQTLEEHKKELDCNEEVVDIFQNAMKQVGLAN